MTPAPIIEVTLNAVELDMIQHAMSMAIDAQHDAGEPVPPGAELLCERLAEYLDDLCFEVDPS